jgi:hypothetical protein
MVLAVDLRYDAPAAAVEASFPIGVRFTLLMSLYGS